MSRQIKFRAWDKTASTDMLGPYEITDSFFGERKEFISDYILMQFTGLLDKNGKEIYEGDVIEFRNIDASVSNLRLPVIWDEKLCGFWCDDGKNTRNMEQITGYDTISGEIIGNTYENPELIK